MTYKKLIEWQDTTDEWQFTEVTFSGFPEWENTGIGSYEYWGAKEYDYGHDYLSFEAKGSPEYDASKYTNEEVREIEKYLKYNMGELEQEMIDEFEEQEKREKDNF